MILLTTSGVLSFVIYTYRNLLFGGMLTDILGHSICTAFVATCMYIANNTYVTIGIMIFLYDLQHILHLFTSG